MTTVVISQPMLFPWPGFFELVSEADIFVHFDDVEFSKGSFTNRVQLKHPNGIKWLTIPLAGSGSSQRIDELQSAGNNWKRAHRDLVSQCLKGAQHRRLAVSLLDWVYADEPVHEILIRSIELTARTLHLAGRVEWLRSSSLQTSGRKSQRVLEIVTGLKGTRYVTAHGAYAYLDHEAFERAGVKVDYIQYSRCEYPQLHGAFTPYVSILDLIANVGPQSASYLSPRTVPWREFSLG